MRSEDNTAFQKVELFASSGTKINTATQFRPFVTTTSSPTNGNRSTLLNVFCYEQDLLDDGWSHRSLSNAQNLRYKRPLGRSRHRWEDNIKMDHQETG